MSVVGPPVWVSDLAERFWADAGGPADAFPRELEDVAPFAVRVVVVRRPDLRVRTVIDHLRSHRNPVPFDEPDRPLRAALYCWAGFGTVFLDPEDPPDEQRFSFAHELAHFLRDYADPRRKVARSLGTAAVEVLDGLRPPTADERLHAVLRHRPLTPHSHLMHRDASGRPKGDDERRAEAAADRLAFELLAPAGLFRGETDPDHLSRRLTAEFGLPPAVAGGYARLLLPPPDSVGGLIARVTKSR
jgi:hypothetical protein